MLTCARGSCAIVMGVLALAGLMAGCASEKAKVNVPFKLVSSSGKALEKIQVTFLSKDGKYAEMSQSQDGGIGSVMLFPEEYDVGVNKYEGGKSMQAMKAGTPEYEEAMAKEPPKKRGRPPKAPVEKNPYALEKMSVADRIGTMLREYNNPLVADAAELRLVVTNKLLDLATCGDPRIEIKAAEMLGKISDVGLFSDKTEITVTYNNVADIDEAIKDKIRKMMRMHAIDVTPLGIDIDAELGMYAAPVIEPELELELEPVKEIPDEA